MKCDEKDDTVGACVRLDDALQQLGMLSRITEARRDFLHESRAACGIMRINTRYVSNVTVGYCVRRTHHPHRLCPYSLPHRHRTKSENSDSKEAPPDSESRPTPEKTSLKRCQSLESLNKETLESQELEGVSTRIQRLQVE